MTKGELRKHRKQARAEGREYAVVIGESCAPEMAPIRTRREEQRRRDGWDRWAKRMQDRDDY